MKDHYSIVVERRLSFRDCGKTKIANLVRHPLLLLFVLQTRTGYSGPALLPSHFSSKYGLFYSSGSSLTRSSRCRLGFSTGHKKAQKTQNRSDQFVDASRVFTLVIFVPVCGYLSLKCEAN